jgi:hypothetical protein
MKEESEAKNWGTFEPVWMILDQSIEQTGFLQGFLQEILQEDEVNEQLIEQTGFLGGGFS